MNIATDQQPGRFAWWIRTGKRVDDELELKFNPWHDPDDGRFTFAGAGRHFARGSTVASSERVSPPSSITYGDDPAKPPITTLEEAEAWAVSERAKRGTTPGYAQAIDARLKLYRDRIAPRSGYPTEQRSEEVGGAAGFADGLGDGVYDVGRGLVVGVYTLATSPPRQTIENNALGIARAVDAVLAAEDTPGHVLIGRGANAITNASAHDWGYAVGTIAANVGLGVGSRALVTKLGTVVETRRSQRLIAAEAPLLAPVPRAGPKGLDPKHHNANVLSRDAKGNVVAHQRLVSGYMTPQEKTRGFPLNTYASHTEARAVRYGVLVRGGSMIITGQKFPCSPCRGQMKRAAHRSGSVIIYRWRENGKTRSVVFHPTAIGR